MYDCCVLKKVQSWKYGYVDRKETRWIQLWVRVYNICVNNYPNALKTILLIDHQSNPSAFQNSSMQKKHCCLATILHTNVALS